MTDLFTQALARQLQRLFSTVQSGVGKTGQGIESGFIQGGAEMVLTPQQIVEVMQGNSTWVQQFENQLERQFTDLADRMLQHWLDHTDKEIRKSLKELAEAAIRMFQPEISTQELDRIMNSGDIRRSLHGAVARSAAGLVEEMLTLTRTHKKEGAGVD